MVRTIAGVSDLPERRTSMPPGSATKAQRRRAWRRRRTDVPGPGVSRCARASGRPRPPSPLPHVNGPLPTVASPAVGQCPIIPRGHARNG
jgi:hypothetical protein